MSESKIIQGLRSAAAAAKCQHQFEYLREHSEGGGLVALCLKCRCRFTAWPGSVHYDEIMKAREALGR